jgi:hypothetical protein
MSLATEYAERIQTIIAEIRAQLISLPEPQRAQAEQRLQEMERITSEMAKK